jgi:predicted CXXCH cytochrome family protein
MRNVRRPENAMHRRFLAAAAAACLAGFGVGASEASAGNCIAGGCHRVITGSKFLHGPVAAEEAGGEGCVACHMPAGQACAAAKAGKFTFKTKKDRLCVLCHERGTATQHTSTRSDCLSCHDPHQSPTKFQLRREVQSKLCESCHRKIVLRIGKSAVLHGPIKEGKCVPCHNPHAADCWRLFPACDTAEADTWGSKENAAYVSLCWQCHPKADLLDPESHRTGFRDGTRNLHRLHVLQKRPPGAHPCKRCHETHAGSEAKLLRDDITTDRGVFSFPVRFKPAGNGGTCSVECHRDFSYDRIMPVNEAK